MKAALTWRSAFHRLAVTYISRHVTSNSDNNIYIGLSLHSFQNAFLKEASELLNNYFRSEDIGPER